MIFVLLILLITSSILYSNEDPNIVFKNNIKKNALESIGLKKVPSYNGRHFTSDCIGFVKYIYFKSGLDINKFLKNGNTVKSFYNELEKRNFLYDAEVPEVGDLIFFDNTYDINNNGKWDDPISHIGIVSDILKHDTIVYVHYASGEVKESRINLKYKYTHAFRQKDGSLFVINSYLRRNRGEGFEKKEYISSSFYRCFGKLRVKWKN